MASITRWNPIREMAAMQQMMDRMMDDSLRGFRSLSDALEGEALALDVHEAEDHFTVSTALPGVDPDHIHINLHDDVLSIEAEIPEHITEQKDGERVLLKERSWGKFSRRIRLPQSVNAEAVEAEHKDGILTLTLPKAENALPRSIKVKRIEG